MKIGDKGIFIQGTIMSRIKSEEGIVSDDTTRVIMPKNIDKGYIDTKGIETVCLSRPLKEKELNNMTREGDIVLKLSTPYDCGYVTEEAAGCMIPSFCVIFRTEPYNEDLAEYLNAVLNTGYVSSLMSHQSPDVTVKMLRISDLREINLPDVSEDTIRSIGCEYSLSSRKRMVLKEMIHNEDELMENRIYSKVFGKDGK